MDLSQIPPAMLAVTPALKPPKGVTPNFKNPESTASDLIGIAIFGLILMWVFVSGRMITAVRSRKIGADDWVCLVAAILAVGYAAVCIQATTEGFGKHQWDVPIINFKPSMFKTSFAEEIMYGPTIFSAKLALFLLYYRVFKPIRYIRYLVYFGITFAGLLYVTNVFLCGIMCSPRPGRGGWASPYVLNRCNRTTIFAPIQGGLNMVLDLYILILPMRQVSKLKLKRSKKIGVMCIFGTGILALITAILGFVYRIYLVTNADSTWNTNKVSIVAVTEINIAIVCACMPAMSSFLTATYTKLSSTLSKISGTSTLKSFISHHSPLKSSSNHSRWAGRHARGKKFSNSSEDSQERPVLNQDKTLPSLPITDMTVSVPIAVEGYGVGMSQPEYGQIMMERDVEMGSERGTVRVPNAICEKSGGYRF